jgi:hypothetical protein
MIDQNKIFTGYKVVKDEYSGKKLGEHEVWLDRGAADFYYDRKLESCGEWEQVRITEVKFTQLTENKGQCDNQVVTINRTTRPEMVREHALQKLSREERVALGLS